MIIIFLRVFFSKENIYKFKFIYSYNLGKIFLYNFSGYIERVFVLVMLC